MGCGQSKINLYPRRNKNGGKGNSAKKSVITYVSNGSVRRAYECLYIRAYQNKPLCKDTLQLKIKAMRVPNTPWSEKNKKLSRVFDFCRRQTHSLIWNTGAADKEADEEEGNAGAGPTDDTEEDAEHGKHILPLTAHPSAVEVSASMQDFFKVLDEKIDKGKDYDSSSETELRIEKERRKKLIDQWRSASQSTQSSLSQPSPPTPARRRIARPPQPPERQNSPGAVRRCYRQAHVQEGMSPPPRRSHSAQSHHPPDPRQINGDNWHDPNKSPVKRPQSAGANWKSNPKVAPYNQKPKKNEVNENQRNLKDSDTSLSISSSQDGSQITYNPTFQTHSPAHSAKSQQPYIAQIISYPLSQQVTPPSPPKFIAPPEEYQDPQNNVVDNKYNANQRQPQNTQQVNSQSHIYYIHGNTTGNANQHELAQQRQQTALHLQQYVAMKQAQQQMFSYLQRGPHTVFPNVDYSQMPTPRIYEGEEYTQYGHLRPHSAPTPVGVVRPMPISPAFNPLPDGSHMVQMPWPHMPPVVSTMGPWLGQGHDQYYPQSQFMMYRAQSAGSAGTLTRYHKKDDGEVKCQSINIVRQKQIGQIVSIPGQDLTVCNPSDSPSPSVSTDSGVSPGNSAPITKAPGFSQVSDLEKKKIKPAPFARSLKNSKSLDS